ncbi:MAG: hypothetical protein WCO94_09205 [Verrucomicrobiota bacterium]
MDSTQKKSFLIATGVTIGIILYAGAEGFPAHFREADPKVWAYALAQSIGSSFVCLITYFIYVITDLFSRKRRFKGWFLCTAMSVVTVFVFLYLLPPPKSVF